MELKHIKGIGPAKQTKLNDAGITTVHDLAHADVDATAKTTGISASTVRGWKESAVALTLIEDVRGIGPNTFKTLAESGVSSLKDLYEASSGWLAAQAKVTEEKAREIQAEAKKVYERVAADAKTSEGRQKLVAEGKDLAIKAANKTQEEVQKVLAKAQEEGEAAIAKAKELRETAPARLQEYREKAEKALKDAEAQVVSLKEKAPDTVKQYTAKAEAAVKDAQSKVVELKDKTSEFVNAETQKVKAANEGFLRRVKARFGGN